MSTEPPDSHQDTSAASEPAADWAPDGTAMTIWPILLPDSGVDVLTTTTDGGFTVYECKTSRGKWAQAAQHSVSKRAAQRLTQAAAALSISDVRFRGSWAASTPIRPLQDGQVRPVAVDLLLPCSCNPRVCGDRPQPRCTCRAAERAEQRAAWQAATVENAIADLLRNWEGIAKVEPDNHDNLLVVCPQAHTRLSESLDAERDVLTAVGAARKATQAAFAARDSILHDTPTVSYGAVADFTNTWLLTGPRTPNRALVEAVTEALLFTHMDDLPDDYELVKRINNETRRQRRACCLITETTLCHQPVMSLDQALRPNDESRDQGTLADQVASSDSVEDLVATRLNPIDDRATRVLNRLKPDELAVTQAYIHDSELSWHRAAEMCGHEPTFGTRVQRKLRRLGQQLLDRITSAPGTA